MPLIVLPETDTLELSDELSLSDLKLLETKLQSINKCTLVLVDLYIQDGSIMGGLTRILTTALRAKKSLILLEPQQLVVHNLYRVGFLNHPELTIINARADEAYG